MKKPLIPYGWLRAIVFILIYIIAALAAGLIIVLGVFIWKFIQDGALPNIASVKAMAANIFWLASVASVITTFSSVWFARKVIDKQSFFSLGFAWKGFENHAYTGLFGAIAMLSAGTIILLLLKYLSFTDISFDPLALLGGMAMMIGVAFSEELIFRGYLLNNLMQSMNKWVALLVTAFVFACMHLGNPGMGIFSFLEIFVAGVMLGVNYIYTKNLWFGILLHFAWNFMQGPILGYEVSGINMTSILHQTLSGPAILTGGTFGFEGSILSMLFNLVFIGVLVFVYEKRSVSVEGDKLVVA